MEQRPFVTVDLHSIAETLHLSVTSNVTVTGVTHDSRDVRPGDLYVAIPGLQRHGIDFASEALANGAVAVASDDYGCDQDVVAHIPRITLKSPRLDMAHVAACVYGHPEKKLHLIGVTGTNGKTTVTQMLRHVLSDKRNPIGIIGTLGAFIGAEQIPTGRTTPESTDLYALLALMVSKGVNTVCMEVSSHALTLNRVAGLHFDVALFTNLTQDHLDFHGDMENYFAAKAVLFQKSMATNVAINTDDEWGIRLLDQCDAPVVESVGCDASWRIADAITSPGETTFDLIGHNRKFSVTIPMFGRFNTTNAALCLTAVDLIGESVSEAVTALKSLPQVPGRTEVVWHENDRTAIVDYAHTPDAVEKVLTQIQAVNPRRIITVIGCGGDRDAAKRPIMGRIAASHSDAVLITDDNPRSEVPEKIRQAIAEGITNPDCLVEDISDRRLAIRRALELCKPGDVVVVLGKGHETGQEIAGVITEFDDREVVRQEATRA